MNAAGGSGPDLSPLERVAAEAGYPGVVARVIPAGRRRANWFAVRPGVLLVSERVLERLPPPEACALLLAELLRQRRTRRLKLFLGAGVPAFVAGAVAAGAGRNAAHWPWLALLVGCALAFAALWRQRLVHAADDDCVERLGDATRLVRALNGMDRGELRVGGWALKAHPDLHARAERLARRHAPCVGRTEP